MGMRGQYVLADEDSGLLDFYRKAAAAGKHVIFSVV